MSKIRKMIDKYNKNSTLLMTHFFTNGTELSLPESAHVDNYSRPNL